MPDIYVRYPVDDDFPAELDRIEQSWDDEIATDAPRPTPMQQAEAMCAALGRAQRKALDSVALVNVMDMPRRNLRARLLVYAEATREPLLHDMLPYLRERAKQAVRAYRKLREGGR